MAEANRRLAARDGDRTNLDGIEPVVLEDTVARQDEAVSTFSIRHSDGDLLAGVLEEQFVVARDEPANEKIAAPQGTRRRMIPLVEGTSLREEGIDGGFVHVVRDSRHGDRDDFICRGMDGRRLGVASHLVSVNGPQVA